MAYMIWGRMAQHISKIESMASIGSILLRIYHPYVATIILPIESNTCLIWPYIPFKGALNVPRL